MGAFEERTKLLIGEAGVEKLKSATVTVIGVGGVGGYAVEILARAGVGKLILVDGDVVDASNKNRQIIATDLSVGRPKVEVCRERIFSINPDCIVTPLHVRFDRASAEDILGAPTDFVVDAIDSVPDKVELIVTAKQKNLPIISAMGAGQRLEAKFRIADIYQTAYDPLAKKMRKLLKDRGVKALDVCFSDVPPVGAAGKLIGSISYGPALCGVEIGAHVIRRILE